MLASAFRHTFLRSSHACAFAFSLALVAHAQPSDQDKKQEKPAYVLKSAPLTIDEKMAVPSHVLHPGQYSIQVIDRFNQRYIMRIVDKDNKEVAAFVGLHDDDLDSYVLQNHTGVILWPQKPKGGPAALRGYAFPDGTTLEFAYPKDTAIALATANKLRIIAVDPESEGLKPDPKLKPEDREVVTLWMLTPTKIGKDQPAMEAKKFVPQPDLAAAKSPRQPAPAPSSLMARNEPPPNPVADPAPQPKVQPQARTQPRPRAFASKLPQTGSNLPLLALLSVALLAGASTLRLTRVRGYRGE